jgi:hypothetical protein
MGPVQFRPHKHGHCSPFSSTKWQSVTLLAAGLRLDRLLPSSKKEPASLKPAGLQVGLVVPGNDLLLASDGQLFVPYDRQAE